MPLFSSCWISVISWSTVTILTAVWVGACLIVFVIADVFMPTLRPKQQTALPVDEKIGLKLGKKKEGTQEIVGTNTKFSPGVGSEKLDLRTQSRLAAEVGHNVKSA
jgi:hypothetical protein